jgi:trans-aconitate methyltransferase
VTVAGTPWDAHTYDRSSEPQQAWAAEVLARLEGIAPDATVLDVGCGTARVTQELLALVPEGRVLAMDASADMVAIARTRLGDRAQVWCQTALDLDLDEPVDAIVSTAALHWIPDHDRLWGRLADALRPGGVDAFVRTSILAAHLERLPEERQESFAAAVVAGVHAPLEYVRLNVSAVRGPA